jgi:hypothetical protein
MALPIFQRTVVTDTGDVVSGAEIKVEVEATGLDADIFSDREGNTPLDNPFLTDVDGFAQFFVAPGEYRVIATGPTGTITWNFNALVGSMALQESDDVNITGGSIDSVTLPATTVQYNNSASGLTANQVQAAIDELADIDVSVAGLFSKAQTRQVAWTKTGNTTAESQTDLTIEINDELVFIPEGTSITMPTLTAGTDYAIMALDDGTLSAQTSFTPPANGRQVGGFHFAPGGNASFALNAGDGGTTPQINEFSFYDLKWRPSVIDPRGLTCVGNGAFWTGIYFMSANHLTGPVHKHGVNACRDGNPPRLVDDSGNYPNASPMNIFEALRFHGFRSPRIEEFQLLAYGTNEAASRGSDPGTTGLPGGNTDAQFTSHWGVIQSTGVYFAWGQDSILSTSDQTLPNPSRGNRFRVSQFARLGGGFGLGSSSGSRHVDASTATLSLTNSSSRGVCDHLILD